MIYRYRRIAAANVPHSLGWDTPKNNQGQIVEVSYSRLRSAHTPAGPGARYRRTIDRSDGSTTYAVLIDEVTS